MSRVFLIVIDSVGIGGAPDADRFFNGDVPDTGANTLGHIAAWRAARGAPLELPVMGGLGLWHAAAAAVGGAAPVDPAEGAWAAAEESSPGKDTPSGHWELAGRPVPFDWTVFPDTVPAFPPELVERVKELAGTDGILGNCHASGTEIIARLGAEHMKTGWPICYTSADSVFQIAAHEETFGLDRLLTLCRELAPTLHAMRVGRVIARPFVGSPEEGFTRTGNRRDFALEPPDTLLCDWVHAAGHPVHAVGKIGDIFSMRGIDEVRKGDDLTLMGHLDDLVQETRDGALVFANLVEFDSLYGHRRDPGGYAAHLERFDAWLGRFLPRLGEGDLCIVTADHGNDPTWVGTDHTRERVPVLIHGAGARPLGLCRFVDVGATAAAWLGVTPEGPGRNLLDEG